MSVLADLYVSTDTDAPSYDTTQSLPDSDRAQGKSLTPLELSTLWAILQGREWDVSMMNDFQCILNEDEGERLIHRIPATVVSQLTQCDPEGLKRAASRWAQTDELACDPSDIEPLLETLIRLAHRAQETGKNLYLLWNCENVWGYRIASRGGASAVRAYLPRIIAYGSLVVVAGAFGVGQLINYLGVCSRFEEGAIACVNLAWDVIGELAMLIMLMTAFTLLPAIAALVGLAYAVYDLVAWLRAPRDLDD